MAREFSRSDRVADAMLRVLASAIAQEVRDPRVGMVNVNEVAVSRDMAYAKVYITFVSNTDEDIQERVAVLNRASGFLRSIIAKSLNMRTTPQLQFIYDSTSVKGQALSSLIDKALAEDAAHRVEGEKER